MTTHPCREGRTGGCTLIDGKCHFPACIPMTPPWARTDVSREGRTDINRVAASSAGLSRQREPTAD